MGMREYTAGLDELDQGLQAESGLTRSLSVSAEKNPDEEARALSLSEKTGIPADWIPEFKEETARRSLLNRPAVRELPRTSPKTTAWLSDRDNAAVAHDDIETLAGIEGIVDMMGRGAPDLRGVPTAFGRGLKAGPSRLSTGLAETGDILLTPFLEAGAKLTGSELLRDLARAPRIATDYWRAEADRIAGKQEPGTVAAYAGQIGESVGSSVLSMPFGIAGQGAALAMFGLGSEGGYRKYTDAGYNETYAALLALSTKAMEGITEKMGLDVLYNPEKVARPAFRVALQFLVGELGGEEINTLWEAAKDKLTLEPNMTMADVAARVVDTAIVTVGAAGAQGVTAHYAARAADRLEMNAAASRNRALMEALGDAAGRSKLLMRLPDKAREFVARVTADGPIESVSVPVEQWTTYFQGKGLDPAVAAAQVLSDTTRYSQAVATGTDIVIPLSEYVAGLAGTEHHAGLLDDLRLRPGDMTVREARAYREQHAERALASPVEEEVPTTPDSKVYTDVYEKLVAAGRVATVAEKEAQLTASVFRSLGTRAGLDPFDLYQRYGLEITGPGAQVFDLDLQGATTEAIRASDTWKSLASDLVEKKFKGRKFEAGAPLTDRLGKMGRIKATGGELRSLNAWENGLIPFFTTKATGRKGESLQWDVALQSLVEEGYLREGSDLDDLAEAIQRDREAKKSGGVRLTPGGVTDYEIEREAARLGYFQAAKEGGKDKRGFLRITPDRKIEIGLLEHADLSTYLHETGHFYLEVLRDLASEASTDSGLAADYATLSRWLGIEGLEAGAAIPTQAQETFARGMEAYLIEGNAPSVELASAFSRFKAWLINIYRDIQALDVQLTDDVRRVFDRLVATDDEIARAKENAGQKAIFATAEAAGMTEAEFAAYRKIAEEASRVASDELEREMMGDLTRERSAWWKEEQVAVRAEVEAQARQNPVFQAYNLLTTGELFDGTAPPMPVKISRAALVEMYGKEYMKTLTKRFQKTVSKEGGVHPDHVAEMFGFTSGDEMVKKLAAAPPIKMWVDGETDRRMKERHGDFQADGSIAEQALKAVHTDLTGQVLAAELRAIKRMQALRAADLRAAESEEARRGGGGRLGMEAAIPPLSVFRDQAKVMIGARRVMEIQPHVYLRAERQAATEVEEALKRQDFAAAGEQKIRQLTNHYLYVEATKAREDADSILSHVQTLNKKAAQIRLGKAGQGYVDQINQILERYEFRPIPVKEIRRRESLLEWARRKEEQGLESAIPEWVLFEARQKNYRTLTIEQLRAVRDALKTIEHLAMVENQLLGRQAAITFDEGVSALLNAMVHNVGEGKRPPLDPQAKTAVEKMSDTFGRFDASLIKMEQVFSWIDGGDIETGPWQGFLFRPIAEAQAREGDMTKLYTEKILSIFKGYAKEQGKNLSEKIYIEALGESLTRGALLSVALNTGNDGNHFKLTKGHGWGDAHIEEMLSHLDKNDWTFVQNVWNAIEELWPEIKALEERLTGLAPPKVEAREIVNEHGTFRGGYYPVVYDPLYSKAGEKQEDARGERLFEGAYVRATTEKGHTKARSDEVARPILLSLEVIPQHVAGVIHDLTHREPVVQAHRLLNDARVRGAVITTMGQPYHNAMNKWLASIANDRNIDRTGIEFWNRFFSRIRTNATIVSMGFKATTMVSQIVGLSNSLDLVKGKYLGNAVLRFARQPFESTAWVRSMSGEMRHRFETMDRDIRDGIRKLQGKEDPLSWFKGKAFSGIGVFDALVSVPTWMGAYEQALAGKMSVEDAIAAADQAVRLSQGAGGAKDLAAIQRNNELMKLFTMFYSYFNALYGRLRNAGRMVRIGQEGFADLAWRTFILAVLPPIIQELMVARGPDDDEDPAWWALRKILVYPFMTIPVIRDVANSLDSGRDYQLTPVAQAIGTTVKVARTAERVATGEREPEDLLFPLVDLTGYAVGLPTGQAKVTGRYLWDVIEGSEEIDSVPGFFRDTLFTRKKK